jgi:hypothetical protein
LNCAISQSLLLRYVQMIVLCKLLLIVTSFF